MKRKTVFIIAGIFLSIFAFLVDIFLFDEGGEVGNGYIKNSDTINVKLREGGEVPIKYSDEIFSQKSTEYNHLLSQISLGVASSAFSTVESDEFWGDTGDFGRDKNIVKLYEDLGFSNIKTYNYDKSLNDKTDSVAFALAEKTVNIDNEKYRIIGVAVRGGGYGNEWVSNFNLGSGEVHNGFLLSATEVALEILNYSGNKNDKTKLWICGFSRGGAVANIVAARLGDTGKINRENIYAYSFASPRVTLFDNAKDKKYSYIFNIISDSDFVPLFPPSAWGYQRFGRDVTLPHISNYNENTQKAQTAKIESIYRQISNGEKLKIAQIEESKHSQNVKKAIEGLTTVIKSKENYESYYEEIIMDFIEYQNTRVKNSNGNWVSIYSEDENVNEITMNESEITGLMEIAGLFYSGGGNIIKIHSPESYIAQLLAISDSKDLKIE